MKKLLALLLCCILVFGMNGCAANFSEDENYAISCAKKLKSYCKSPTSFALDGDVLVFTTESTQKKSVICYFEYSAENSFGVLLANNAVFCDGEYLGSTDDMHDEADEDSQKADALHDSGGDWKTVSEHELFLRGILVDFYGIRLVAKVTGNIPENGTLISQDLVMRAIK